MLKCILLGLLASAPAWAFSAPGGLGSRGWRGECAASLSVQHKNLVHVATRPRWHTAVLSLSATQNLAVDPEAAWAQYSSSDGRLLSAICPTLRVLEPATGREVTVGEVVGNGKGLVVFMRHVG